MAVTNKPRIEVIVGASGSGKSSYAKQVLAAEKPKNLLIFDPMGEYGKFVDLYTDLKQIGAALDRGANGRGFKVGYRRPDPRQGEKAITDEQLKAVFNKLCGWAYQIGDCFFLADELQLVDDPRHAPASWVDCTARGRHHGMKILALCQRPSSLNKSCFDNASKVRTGRLIYAPSVKTMTDVLNVRGDEIRNLEPLEYIERDMSVGGANATVRGKLTF